MKIIVKYKDVQGEEKEKIIGSVTHDTSLEMICFLLRLPNPSYILSVESV